MNDLITQESASNLVPTASAGHANALSSIMNTDYLIALEKFSDRIANSQLIPAAFRGKPGDIFIALHMAGSMGADWLQVLQNLHVVKGTPGWSAKFIIAQANVARAFKTNIRFREAVLPGPQIEIQYKVNDTWKKYSVPNLAITAFATGKDDKEISFEVSMEMAQREGWTTNPKYHSLPKLMLSYRAGAFLVRLHAPEVMFGYSTQEEIEDMAYATGMVDNLALESGGAGVSNESITEALTQQAARATNPAAIRDRIVAGIQASATTAELEEVYAQAATHFSGQQLAGITKIASKRRQQLYAEHAATTQQGASGGSGAAGDTGASVKPQQETPAAQQQPTQVGAAPIDPGFEQGFEEVSGNAGGGREPGSDDDLGDARDISGNWRGDDEPEPAAQSQAATGGMAGMAQEVKQNLLREVKEADNPAALARLRHRAQQMLVGFPQHLSEVSTAIAVRTRTFRQAS